MHVANQIHLVDVQTGDIMKTAYKFLLKSIQSECTPHRGLKVHRHLFLFTHNQSINLMENHLFLK